MDDATVRIEIACSVGKSCSVVRCIPKSTKTPAADDQLLSVTNLMIV